MADYEYTMERDAQVSGKTLNASEPHSVVKIRVTKIFKVKYQTSDGYVVTTKTDQNRSPQVDNYSFMAQRKTLCKNSSRKQYVLDLLYGLEIDNATRTRVASTITRYMERLVDNDSDQAIKVMADLEISCFRVVNVHAAGHLLGWKNNFLPDD